MHPAGPRCLPRAPRPSGKPVATAAARRRVSAPQCPLPYFRRPTGGGNRPPNRRYVRPAPRPISTAAWPGPAPRGHRRSRGAGGRSQRHYEGRGLGPQVCRRVPDPVPNPDAARPAVPQRRPPLMEEPREKATRSFPFLHSPPAVRTRPSDPTAWPQDTSRKGRRAPAGPRRPGAPHNHPRGLDRAEEPQGPRRTCEDARLPLLLWRPTLWASRGQQSHARRVPAKRHARLPRPASYAPPPCFLPRHAYLTLPPR